MRRRTASPRAVWRRGRPAAGGRRERDASNRRTTCFSCGAARRRRPRGGDVDVRRDELRRAVEQLARGDGPSFHGDDGTSAVDRVGTRLARTGARHRVGAAEPQALLLDERLAPLRLAEEVRAGGEVEHHVDATFRHQGARRHGRPEILADFDAEPDRAGVEDGKRFVGWGRRELPPLVVFAVVRQRALADDARDLAAVDDGRRVVDGGAFRDRQADDGDERQVRRLRGEGLRRRKRRVEELVAEEHVAAGVARQAQFGEHDRGNAVLGGVLGEPHELLRVRRRIAQVEARRRGCDSVETFHDSDLSVEC